MNIYEQLNKIDDTESLSEKYNVKNAKELKKLQESNRYMNNYSSQEESLTESEELTNYEKLMRVLRDMEKSKTTDAAANKSDAEKEEAEKADAENGEAKKELTNSEKLRRLLNNEISDAEKEENRKWVLRQSEEHAKKVEAEKEKHAREFFIKRSEAHAEVSNFLFDLHTKYKYSTREIKGIVDSELKRMHNIIDGAE